MTLQKQTLSCHSKVIIVGAGVAGLMMAIQLGRRGVPVKVIEKRKDPKSGGYKKGRSINFTLSSRGLAMLREVGLENEVLSKCVRLDGRVTHFKDGTESFQPYGVKKSEVLHAIKREDLLNILYNNALIFSCVKIEFDQTVSKIDLNHNWVTIKNSESGYENEKFDLIICADGSRSKIARDIAIDNWKSYSFNVSKWVYKEFHIEKISCKQFLNLNALHLWSSHGVLICAIPNQDGTLIGNYIYQNDDANQELMLDKEIFQNFFDNQFLGLSKIDPNIFDKIYSAKSNSIVSVSLEEWCFSGKCIFIGDSAHAIPPYLGQGMNAALEDAVILNRYLNHNEIDTALKLFFKSRKIDTDALQILSEQHLKQLRDGVGSVYSRVFNKTLFTVCEFFPAFYGFRYSLIAHTVRPYREALSPVLKFNEVLIKLSKIPIQIGLIMMGLLR